MWTYLHMRFELQAAQAVLLALHNLNTSEFDVMMSVLPKTFQVCLESVDTAALIAIIISFSHSVWHFAH